MEKKLKALVKENTISKCYEDNNATDLGKSLGLSRNWISQYLNDFYNDGTFIKINTRPVLFIDRRTIEKREEVVLKKGIFSSLEELEEEIQSFGKKDFQTLIGFDGSLKNVVESCKASVMYPPNGLPTLLYGPTGTGKSAIAEKIFEYGKSQKIFSKDAKFVHVNCSEYANNPELITANLFGYKKGAFTGADSDNAGLIKAADGGMLFLDEVHCLKPECQEKLFLFMDKGSYHVLGDSEKEYKSDVYLAFATTEEPKKALLKTLLRRIPLQIQVPSLNQRGEKEKSEIIISFFDKEASFIKKNIRIGNVAYNMLMNFDYEGNIGELQNVIRQTCMNALYLSNSKKDVEISTLNLPDYIIANNSLKKKGLFIERRQFYDLEELKNRSENDIPFKKTADKLLKYLVAYQNNDISTTEFFKKCENTILKQASDMVYEEKYSTIHKTASSFSLISKIIEEVNDKYQCDFQANEMLSLVLMIRDYNNSLQTVDRYLNSYEQEIQTMDLLFQKYYSREYMIAQYINELCGVYLGVNWPSFVSATFALFIHSKLGHKSLNENVGVILSHGYATASSIADAVNKMLGAYVFEAIDMPLDTSTEMILNRLNVYLSKRQNIRNLILLVDMGSLEAIHAGLSNISKANIAVANNVNTKFALYVGDGILKNKPLKQIFDESIEANKTHCKIIESKEKEKLILCSCATGIGTAEKLKEILEDSLPEHIPLKVMTYDYSSLIEKELNDQLFKEYEVICVVGTLNPNIKNLKFIPVEDLIINQSFDFLLSDFENLIDDEGLEEFQKKLLKNFSLTNIIGNLTFLNPTQLLEKVSDAIDTLQDEMNTSFSSNMCFGLYVHICCLMERLIVREAVDHYTKTIEECSKEFEEFYDILKDSFRKIEKYYKVQIPIEEVEYIYIYINNMLNTKQDNVEEEDE